MSGNICGITPTFGYSPAMLYDFDKIDLLTSMPSMPSVGMNFGAFGSCPMPVGMGMGFGMGMGGYDPSAYFENMKRYQQYYNQYNIDQQKLNRNANLQINAPMESIEDTAACLRDKIHRNEQGQIMDAYRKYVQSIANAYGAGSVEELNSRAIMMYERLNGKTIVDDLREHAHGSMLQGYLQALSLGTYAARSAEDNIADITGQKVATGEKFAQNAGRVLGSATVGGAVYGLLRTLTRTGKGKAGIIATIVTSAVGALTFLTGKAKATT